MALVAQAFLFDADAEGVSDYYGADFEPPFLRALSKVDPSGTTRSTVLVGDVIVGALCERVSAVSKKLRESSHTLDHDMDLYRTIIWDLADAFAAQWNTLDIEAFPLALGRHNVFCITMMTLPADFREGMDTDMREVSGYLGSVEIDLGNPIQKRLLIDQLIDIAVIDKGRVVMELSIEGTAETTFVGSEEFIPNGEHRVEYGDLDGLKPAVTLPSRFSDRGQVSADRYDGKRRYTVHDRVLSALAWLGPHQDGPASYSFNALPDAEDAFLEAQLPEGKFVRYLLNPQHADGKAKAKFFNDELGIGSGDWQYLAAQFYAGLRTASLSKLKIKAWEDGYGASFNCVMPIRGLNGRVSMVETNWIVRPGLVPQLSTAFPAKRDEAASADYCEPVLIVPTTLIGNGKWEALYATAHDAGSVAATRCVPTPMKVVGFDVEMEGACGFAHIRILDARKGFARWVVRSSKGRKHYISGASIYAKVDSQSYDRAVAYAEAFATVLRLNGVDCSVQARFD